MARGKPGNEQQGIPPQRRLSALLALILVTAVYLAGGLDFVERQLLDLRFRLDQRQPGDELVIVAIDRPSLQSLNTWPWPRAYHAELIDRLVAAGAARIAFDVDFSSPSTPEMDARLEQALEAAGGRVILPVLRQLHATPAGPVLLDTEPLPRFRGHVDVASITVQPADDGLIRTMALRMPWGDGWVPTLSALLAGQDNGDAGAYAIDYSLAPAAIPRLSYADVLRGNFDPGTLRGRQVLIGATAAELQDAMPVPVFRSISGVVLHAMAYHSLIQDRVLRPIGRWPVLLLALAVMLGLAGRFADWSWQRGLAVLVGGAGLLLAASAALQAAWPLILDTTPIVVLLALLYGNGLVGRIDRQTLWLFMQNVRLRRLDGLMRNVVENSFDAIVTVRGDGRVETANAAADAIFGFAPGELAGRHIGELLPSQAQDDESGATAVLLLPGQREASGRRQNGVSFPLELAVSETSLGEERLFIVIVRDVTERKAQEARLEHQALHDALTGLPNRTLLKDRLSHAVALAKREQSEVALLLLDLDRFKAINDTLGHQVGDIMLRDLAQRLSEPLRRSDTIARLGGDEFAILLPPGGDMKRARRVAQRLRKALEKPFLVEGLSLEVSGSLGIAVYPEHAETADGLLQCADVAMYMAKHEQAGIAVYNAAKDHNSVRYLTLTGELRQAIETGQLSFHYQPKLDLRASRVTGVEALARWNHPTHGFIPPEEFILQAEQTGLIQPLTLWAFNTALAQLCAWRDAGLEIDVAINLSARNLHDGNVPELLNGLLRHWRIEPHWLTVEVTESAIMIDPETAMQVCQGIRALGLKLALDDFGTGHSSLGYLKRLPLNELKIDKSFVFKMTEDDNDAAIVRSTIDLAHNLGLEVVAEGVESEAHAQLLRSLGCERAQGYLFSKPLPADQATQWLLDAVPPAERAESGTGKRQAG